MELLLPHNRRLTREITLGTIPMGGLNPIRIQSMTNTNTLDIESTVQQVIRLTEAGCEYVRITAPGVKEAEALYSLKNELYKRGYATPLIADIHFNPKAAEVAAGIVEKVRINPGNYVDRNRGKIHFSDLEYQAELEQIAARLETLIQICKEKGTAIRIGTNHGSLSERIMSRFGNTALGMAASAMEFIRICRAFDFHKLVLSMKASNVNTMIYSTRLLVQMMEKEGFDYPIHLGVTEAGDGEDGRIKSAAGIGALLSEGIGDTLRVSLTEAPEKEIPIAQKIATLYAYKPEKGFSHTLPFDYTKRETFSLDKIGGSHIPVVITQAYSPLSDYYIKDLQTICNQEGMQFPLFPSYEAFQKAESSSDQLNFVQIDTIPPHFESLIKPLVLIASFKENRLGQLYELFSFLEKQTVKTPVIIQLEDSPVEQLILRGASEMGTLFANGWGDGIYCSKEAEVAMNLLQATGRRISKAEFISCPSCGRTQYHIESALQKIKEQTAHLKGLKIGVMGCIVNGPGEMADADYGYVGSGNGKITLYKGKTVVTKDIEESEAVEALVNLIKTSGDWVDK